MTRAMAFTLCFCCVNLGFWRIRNSWSLVHNAVWQHTEGLLTLICTSYLKAAWNVVCRLVIRRRFVGGKAAVSKGASCEIMAGCWHRLRRRRCHQNYVSSLTKGSHALGHPVTKYWDWSASTETLRMYTHVFLERPCCSDRDFKLHVFRKLKDESSQDFAEYPNVFSWYNKKWPYSLRSIASTFLGPLCLQRRRPLSTDRFTLSYRRFFLFSFPASLSIPFPLGAPPDQRAPRLHLQFPRIDEHRRPLSIPRNHVNHGQPRNTWKPWGFREPAV